MKSFCNKNDAAMFFASTTSVGDLQASSGSWDSGMLTRIGRRHKVDARKSVEYFWLVREIQQADFSISTVRMYGSCACV